MSRAAAKPASTMVSIICLVPFSKEAISSVFRPAARSRPRFCETGKNGRVSLGNKTNLDQWNPSMSHQTHPQRRPTVVHLLTSNSTDFPSCRKGKQEGILSQRANRVLLKCPISSLPSLGQHFARSGARLNHRKDIWYPFQLAVKGNQKDQKQNLLQNGGSPKTTRDPYEDPTKDPKGGNRFGCGEFHG